MSIKRITPGPVPEDAQHAMVPMRDGVRLAADVYRRDAPDPCPVVLVRLPYDKDGDYCFMPRISRHFLDRGYHVVVQDVRGKFRSEGATEFAVHEADDGYDTIQWLTEQPWCDGNVVMWGDSYYGYTTIAAAISGHPALKAISPRVTGSQLSLTLEYGDGTRDVEQTSRKVYFATHYVERDTYEWEVDWSARPLLSTFEGFFAELGRRSPNFDREFADGTKFVQSPLKALLAAPPVPALYTIGWFDNCAIWSWHDVRGLSRDPGWSEHLYLRLEPIDHENYHLRDAPIAPQDDHTADSAANDRLLPRYLGPAIEFFDAVLGRSGGGLAALPRVRYEVCHGEWHEDDAWPPRRASELEYHLSASPSPCLTTEAPREEEAVTWTHDPADLVPSAGADPFTALFDRADLSAAADRADVLRFTGPAAAEDTDLVGTVTLQLRLSTPPGANVHVRLLDLTPDGEAFLIVKGQAHLAEPLAAETAVIDLQNIAYRLRAGHRLALDLMSSDFPEYLPEAPQGIDPWTSLPGEPVVRRLTLGGARPSCLRIGRWQPEDLRRGSRA